MLASQLDTVETAWVITKTHARYYILMKGLLEYDAVVVGFVKHVFIKTFNNILRTKG